jgi:hypothetical protein
MSRAAFLAALVLIAPPLITAWLAPGHHARPLWRLVPFLAATFVTFLALSAVLYRVIPYGALKLAVAAVGALVVGYLACRLLPGPGPSPGREGRAFILIMLLAAVSVAGDAFIFSRQGFSADDRTSLFAAPFRGDIQRDTDLIAGLLRETQEVFLPRSSFVYQVLWHHGAANLIAVLPEHFTLFPYVLGLTLVTGFIFYVTLYWLVLMIRPTLSRRPLALFIVAAFAACDADLYNALFSVLREGHVALAADASTHVQTVFRYFSNKLTSLTAPQHATFFIVMSVIVALTYDPVIGRWGRRGWQWRQIFSIVVFAAAGALANPVLTILALPVYAAVLAGTWRIQGRDVRQIFVAGILAGAVGFTLHVLVLRFTPLDLFLRPNITGGGSGVYGVHSLWTLEMPIQYFRELPWVLIATSGVIGAVITVALLWAGVWYRGLFRDTLVLTLIGGTLMWNVVVIETEIQRHFAMIAAYLGVLICARLLPNHGWRRPATMSVLVVAAVLALVLNGYLTRAYSTGGAILDPSVPWTDYYCMNKVIATDFPNLPVVVRTQDEFELPIAAEATASLVWSQVAFVHQKLSVDTAHMLDEINSRDRESFRRAVLSDPNGTIRKLQSLGYRGIIWGPIEEREWGPRVRHALISGEQFLKSCGMVALYGLSSDIVPQTDNPARVAAHEAFVRELTSRREVLCSSAPHANVTIVTGSGAKPPPSTNWALGKAASSSTRMRAGDARHAVNGHVGGAPIAHTEHELSPWWEVDLGAPRRIAAIQLWNRLDCCQERLSTIYVLVSEQPFASSKLYPNCSRPGVASFFIPGQVGTTMIVPVNRRGRYVRIQRLQPGYVALSQVEVWGQPDDPGIAAGSPERADTQSSTGRH